MAVCSACVDCIVAKIALSGGLTSPDFSLLRRSLGVFTHDLLDFFSKFEEVGAVGGLGSFDFFYVESVHRNAVLGGNSCEGNIEAFAEDEPCEPIESCFVAGLHLNDGAFEY